MQRAKLIKAGESNSYRTHESAVRQQSPTSRSVETVREWVNHRQTSERSLSGNARKAFAALFSQPRTA